ncbi:L-carnitine dehydratase/bile acid-inducible protein F [Sulfobacillus acidophilus TPY]|uniref:Formyl-CoA transferase n=1 Tax=Sulfobacillus acidophilus (strain ATCC 700253 / DSM 10332 / NAL) TaxID=679936 RepID=G8TUS4_SULAD|nr:L-carnitine dehydratase/bile acid-inducible protein F [Sulfobacillus acidophilus TPY]AEW05798.1 Formyl-CoA transferase [Sulfobacillus acidophilus DSM 10332]
MNSSRLLQDLVIVDLTRILSGPYCTLYFADWGATVIKIEPPGGDDTRRWGPPFIDGESAYFLSVNRNKKSVVLDLKTDEGRQHLRDLVIQADVVVENFRPGTLDRWGLGYEALKALNSGIILASISGFGQDGPYRDLPGYDLIAQGMGGLMAVTGTFGHSPVKAGFSLADIGAGMWAALGILTALYNRERTGQGAWVDVSLLDTMIAWHTYLAQNYFATGRDPVPLGNAHPSICPYQTFKAQDDYLNIAVGNDKLWRDFCEALDQRAWADDPRFTTNADRVEHREILVDMIEEVLATRPVTDWIERLKSRGVPCGPVYRFSDIYRDPQVEARSMKVPLQHPRLGNIWQVGNPVKFRGSEGNWTEWTPPPELGEHTQEVLSAVSSNLFRTTGQDT